VRGDAKGIAKKSAAPNNGMHPTANSGTFIGNLPLVTARRGG
jgi:hypothetical protein